MRDMLKKFKMNELKGIETPMNLGIILNKDKKGKDIDQKLYRGMIISLLCHITFRLDIHFSVCICTRFQSCLKRSHLITVNFFLNI